MTKDEKMQQLYSYVYSDKRSCPMREHLCQILTLLTLEKQDRASYLLELSSSVTLLKTICWQRH